MNSSARATVHRDEVGWPLLHRALGVFCRAERVGLRAGVQAEDAVAKGPVNYQGEFALLKIDIGGLDCFSRSAA